MATSTEQFETPLTRNYNSELLTNKNFFLILYLERTIVYTSEKNGSDENGDGSEAKPFKTPLQVYIRINISINHCLFFFRHFADMVKM
jgi:hypothetical protein